MIPKGTDSQIQISCLHTLSYALTNNKLKFDLFSVHNERRTTCTILAISKLLDYTHLQYLNRVLFYSSLIFLTEYSSMLQEAIS